MDNLNEKYKSKNPFMVPDGYFEQLGDRVMERVKREEPSKETNWMQSFKPYLGLAALFAFGMVIVQLILPLVLDENKMFVKKTDQVPQPVFVEEESVFDVDFNPSREEIIEYLVQETDPSEFLFAESRL